MFSIRRKSLAGKSPAADRYNRKKATETAKRRSESRSGRDIGPIPDVRDAERRHEAESRLLFFLTEYFKATFTLPWNQNQLQIIDRLQEVVSVGGQYAVADFRGGGKTSIIERAIFWATLTGRRRFAVGVDANETLAVESLDRIKTEIEINPMLLDDFPEIIFPFTQLEAQNRRSSGQLHDGQRTAIAWQHNRIIFPTIPGSRASGAVIRVAGLGSSIRGLNYVNHLGETVRPDLVLADDPQDRESAGSPVQNAQRLAIINGDMLGLGGPGKKIAALAVGTVIYKGDLIDQLLNRDKSPAWTGEKFKLVYRFPTRMDLWERYAELRQDGMRQEPSDKGKAATEYYRANREAMDAGAQVAWAERFNSDELSAVQNAMNLRIDNPDAFQSEYQNEPRSEASSVMLDPDSIIQRLTGFDRGTAGPAIEKVTASIDVGQGLLWWMACGWSTSFDCEILDYGPFPDQPTRMFAARNPAMSLDQIFPHVSGIDGLVYAGLDALTSRLAARMWKRSDGAELPLSRCLIDCGWATDPVRAFVRQSQHRHQLQVSKGVGIGPGQTSMADFNPRVGEKKGSGWILGAAGADRLRLLKYDANAWKTRLAAMLTRPKGSKGGILLSGRSAEHQLLAVHLSSESPMPTTARGVTVDIWRKRPDADNHLLDCLVMAAVAASMEGLSPLASMQSTRKRPRLRALAEVGR